MTFLILITFQRPHLLKPSCLGGKVSIHKFWGDTNIRSMILDLVGGGGGGGVSPCPQPGLIQYSSPQGMAQSLVGPVA